MSDERTLEPYVAWPLMPNGLPYTGDGETFGQYWARLTEEQAMTLAFVGKRMGVLPRSVFQHLVWHIKDNVAEDPHLTREEREDIIDRDGLICGICKAMDGPFHVDHKVPIARGGTKAPSNLWVLCATCNLQKHDMTVEEFMKWRSARGLASE